ncbi:MAG: hypothetical protein GX596_14080 [Propionibacterium sp.]|nr:hypothetical protein [Propionibacterium sp.]
MRSPGSRFTPLALTALVVLAGCASDEPGAGDDPVVDASTPAGVETATPVPSEEPSVEPEEATDAPVPTDEEAASDDPEDAGQGDADPDLIDGVRTNDFNRLPQQLGALERISSQTDPQTHVAVLEYMAPDQSARSQVRIVLPTNADGSASPVTSDSHDEFVVGYDSMIDAFEGQGHDVIERTASTPSHEWWCAEALETQNGVDHALCQSFAHGRLVEVQHLSVAEADAAARNDRVDELLADLSQGLVGLA